MEPQSLRFPQKNNSFFDSTSLNFHFTPKEESRIKFNLILADIPKNQRHILYIDKRCWEEVTPVPKVSPLLFDNEPGYHKAMKNVLNFIGGTLGEKLDALKLCYLHDRCVDNVFRDIEKLNPFLKGYGAGWQYKFNINIVPPATLKELEQERVLHVPHKDQTIEQKMLLFKILEDLHYLSTYVDGFIVSNFKDQKYETLVIDKINNYFHEYYNSLLVAQSDDEKLTAIAKLCRTINMFHPFPDGNGRTVLWAMLPKLLMENDFCPAILEVPEKFAAGYYTLKEMVEQLKVGMKNFQLAIKQFRKINSPYNQELH